MTVTLSDHPRIVPQHPRRQHHRTVNANTVTTLTGAAADLACTTPPASSNLGDEAVTLTDTSLAASVLNTLDGNTTGTVDAGTVTTLSGAVQTLNTAYDSSGITGLGNEAATLSDTTLAASVLNTLDGNTSGTVDANTVTTLTGSASDLITAYGSGGISNLVMKLCFRQQHLPPPLKPTPSLLPPPASSPPPSPMAISNTCGLTETGNAYTITTTDTSDASSPSTPSMAKPRCHRRQQTSPPSTGAADLNTAYAANGSSITGLGNEAATLSDTTLTASVLNTLDGNTTGTIDASAITTLTSDDYDSLNTAYTSANGGAITGLGDEAISVAAGFAFQKQTHLTAIPLESSLQQLPMMGQGNLNISSALSLNGTGNAYSIRIKEKNGQRV